MKFRAMRQRLAGWALLLLLMLPTVVQGQAVAPAASDATPIVAAWQDVRLTLSDFERSYFQYWQATSAPDSPALRREVARQLIEQELIARRGREAGLHLDPGVQARLRQDVGLYLRRRYLERMIRDTIPKPAPAETRDALQRQQRRLYVRQLFARTEDDVRRLRARVEAGEPFAQVARETMPDSAVATRGGALGWIGWGDTDLNVEEVLYALPPDSLSAPVPSLLGWHVFRVDSVEQTIAFGPPDAKTQRDARLALWDRRFDLAAARHLKAMVTSRELVVDRQVLGQVWGLLAPLVPEHPRERALQTLEARPPALGELAETPVAWVDGEPFTVAKFWEALPMLPRGYLMPDLKNAVELAVRDQIVTEAARDAGMADDPVVREKARRAEITHLYTATLQRAADTLTVTEADLRAFYDIHRDRYRDHVVTEVSEILVADRDTALALARRLRTGADFGALARRYTLRDSVRARGGRLGTLRSTDGPLGERAATLAPGELFAPVATEGGYSVLRVEARRVVYQPFEAVREQVVQAVRQQRVERLHRRLLPPDYAPEDIRYYPEQLARAFDDSDTVF